MTIKEMLELLDGTEIISETFEGVVGVVDGQIWQDGKVIVSKPSPKQLNTLCDELFENEFGSYGMQMLMKEFGGQ